MTAVCENREGSTSRTDLSKQFPTQFKFAVCKQGSTPAPSAHTPPQTLMDSHITGLIS